MYPEFSGSAYWAGGARKNFDHGPDLLTDNTRYGMSLPAYTLAFEVMSMVGFPAEETRTDRRTKAERCERGPKLALDWNRRHCR